MPKSEREEMLTALTSRIFSAMLEDLIIDATLQSHHEVARSRAVCRVCHTRCGSMHSSIASTAASQPITSRADTPSLTGDKASGSSGTGTNTPTSVKDGNLYLECVNCARQIASSRYATHLAGCMGLSSARRGAARGNAKSKPFSDVGRSDSPLSDTGNASEDNNKFKGKGKSKVKRVDEAEFNLKRKRPGSPQISPNKKQKKGKPSGSPVSRVKADPDSLRIPNNAHHPPSSSLSKIPSKLRDSSTASFIDKSSTSDSSRSSSPDGASAATPASSSFSHSPKLSSRKIGNGKTKAGGIGPPKRLSPPRPPVLHVPDYSIDIEGGDETGSSTDTDSS
ncbi:hypothetical protein BDZ94DRAFT_1268261 [Collybia nuda]|uniref:SAGA-associated factor 11 n=1 Tax=Collybia nuda TaxID=64659 RepID=A0A9P6CFY6_9AGAR|nr:hypothetical protein BDZ94DRAFT_1268261 [Collybia nuda]